MTFNLKAISSDTILELLFSHSVTSDSLPLRGLQHARLCCPSLSPTVCSKFMSIELMMLSNHLILCHPLLLLPSVYSSIRVSSNESALHIKWPKFWSCSFSISPSNKYPGLISVMIDWFDLPCSPRGSQESSPIAQFKSINLRHSAFFMIPLSHPYMTTGKTIALTRWTFIGKVMFLLVQVCHNFSSKEQASFNFMAAVTICSDLGAQENKVCHCFHCFPIYLP